MDLVYNTQENKVSFYIDNQFRKSLVLPTSFANFEYCPTVVMNYSDTLTVRNYSIRSKEEYEAEVALLTQELERSKKIQNEQKSAILALVDEKKKLMKTIDMLTEENRNYKQQNFNASEELNKLQLGSSSTSDQLSLHQLSQIYNLSYCINDLADNNINSAK